MVADLTYSMHLVIDPRPQTGGWRGALAPGLAIFARPTVTYQDVAGLDLAEPISADRLFAAFVEAAVRRFEGTRRHLGAEVSRSHVIDAAREAFGRFPEAAEAGVGTLELALVSIPQEGRRLDAVHVGAGVVLRIAAEGSSLVVDPHSPLFGAERLTGDVAGQLAAVSTAMLEPRLRWADEVRAAEVELGAGEWLVMAPGSSAVRDLFVAAPPASVAELEREVIGRLAAPYASYPSSWLTVSALFTDPTGEDR